MKQIIAGNSDDAHAEALEDTGYWGKKGAGVLVLCPNTGRFLLAHRSAHVEQPFTWGTVGGAVDEHENVEDAVEREFREETSYKGRMKLVPMFVYKDKSFRYYNFLGIIDQEFTAKPDWETHAFEWFNLSDFPKPLHFGLVSLLKDPESKSIMRRWVQTKSATAVPVDGTYDALQTGYELTYVAPCTSGAVHNLILKVDSGVRGRDIPATVQVTDGVARQVYPT